jgi:hypothetical protein
MSTFSHNGLVFEEVLDTIGCDPSVSKSNQLHVDITYLRMKVGGAGHKSNAIMRTKPWLFFFQHCYMIFSPVNSVKHFQ